MSYDFRSSQIITRAVIGSGSWSGHNDLGLVFYSGSNSSNSTGGVKDSAMLTKVGTDVWMFVSGSTNTGLTRSQGSSVLFGGDLVVSGTLWAERSVIEVDDTVAGDFKAPKKVIAGHQTDGSGFARLLVDPDTPTEGANRTGTISLNIVQGTAGGVYTYPTTTNKDVFFHVSGSKGVQGTNDRGVTLFDGDVFMSGNLALSPSSVFTLPAIDALTGSDGTPWIAHSGSGNVGVQGWFQVHGGEIRDKNNNQMFMFDGLGNLTKELTILKDGATLVLKDTAGTSYPTDSSALELSREDVDIRPGAELGEILWTGRDNLSAGNRSTGAKLSAIADGTWTSTVGTIPTRISVQTPNPTSSTLYERLRIEHDKTTISGSLKLFGGKVLDSGDNEILYLSGSGDATFNKNLTVVGNLMVSGSTVSIGVENLRVEDPVILMGSGSTVINSDGGIAIASGSSLSPQSLTFGRGGNGALDNLWRVGRKDVQDGTVTILNDAVPVGIEASQFRIPQASPGSTDFFITGSMAGGKLHVTMSNIDGDINVLQANTSTFNLRGGAGLNLLDSTGEVTAALLPYQGGLFLDAHADANEQLVGKNGLITLAGVDNNNGPDLAFGIKGASNNPATVFANKIHSKIGEITDTIDKRGLFISGSDHVEIHAHPVAGSPVTRLMLSASSGDLAGGPIIILSSSGEYTGGGASPTRNGFITIGATPTQVDSSFTVNGLRDVSVFLSGAIGSKNSSTRGVVLASGDLHVSGALTAETFALENLTLTSVAADEPYIRFRDSSVQVRRNSLNHLEFADAQSPSSPYTLTQLAALSVTDNTDVFAVTHQDGSSPFLSYVATTGSFSFDHKDTLDGYTARRTNQIGDNVYFFVSGSVGSSWRETPLEPGNGERGVAVFGGDVHISGSLNHTLQDAYSATAEGVIGLGSGSIIDTSGTGRPVQITGGGNNEYVQFAITGSADFVGGGSGQSRIKMTSAEAFGFHNSAGEVFRLVAGSGGAHVRFPNNNQLRFQDDSRYIYGLTESTVKKIRIENTQTGGTVQVSTNTGRMEVTGSLFPGADDLYNLGSPEYRWANIYTGDLHLRNDRGNWTIYEEPDMLVVVNNLTGKKYKMGLTPLEDEE